MSKSKGNVIVPDQVGSVYGADTLRVYEMFMGPFSETIAWDDKGVKGARRFLDKVWKLFEERQASNTKQANPKIEKLLHKTIKKVSEDIENLRFNTAVSALMVLVNEMFAGKEGLTKDNLKTLLLLLAPFAPHLAEELWGRLGQKNSIHLQGWPKYDPRLIKEDTFILVVQVSGRVRDKVEALSGISEKEARDLAISSERVKKWVEGKTIKKVVFVQDKLINIVI